MARVLSGVLWRLLMLALRYLMLALRYSGFGSGQDFAQRGCLGTCAVCLGDKVPQKKPKPPTSSNLGPS